MPSTLPHQRLLREPPAMLYVEPPRAGGGSLFVQLGFRVSKPVSLATRICSRAYRQILYMPLRSKQYRAVHQNIKHSLRNVLCVNNRTVKATLCLSVSRDSVLVLHPQNCNQTFFACGGQASAISPQSPVPHKHGGYFYGIDVLAHQGFVQ